jgi:hypothetical protein
MVRDTGVGIPKDKQERLFRRFSQVDGSVHREFGGTGLGLAISRRLVELMGDRIGVESAEGQESTFWFTITLKRAETPAVVTDQPKILRRPVIPCRILVVEDVEIIRRSCGPSSRRPVIASMWFRTASQRSGPSRRTPYELVLMDVHMPDMDGSDQTDS